METFALVAALTRGGRPDRATLDRFGVSGFVHQRVSRLSAGQTERTALVAGRIGPRKYLGLLLPLQLPG
jgi:hypothetical protein